MSKEYLDQALQQLATREDVSSVKKDVATLKDTVVHVEASVATKENINQLAEQIRTSFSDFQPSVDRYLKRTETWHDELEVLQARSSK